MHILIAEDDHRSLGFLAKGLAESGFAVDTARDGKEALSKCTGSQHHLIILDVMMPEMDGWKVLENLRSMGILTPVLFLTARDSVADRVKGLELGADDYLVKPFAWSEFLARVRTLLRRSPVKPRATLKVANLELDLTRMKARRDGQLIDLTAKEFQVLTLLVRHQGEAISRTTLARQIWDMNFSVDSNAIDVALGRLRKKVDEPFSLKLIHTVRGVGYTLEVRDNV